MAVFAQAVVQNVSRLRERLKKLGEDVQKNVNKALARGAIDIQRTAKNSILAAPSPPGKTYYRGKNGDIAHIASSPGQPPASDTGNLQKMIKIASSEDKKIWYVYVDKQAPYGEWLEFGTTRMEKRPFLHPAFEAHRKEISDSIKDAYHASKKG